MGKKYKLPKRKLYIGQKVITVNGVNGNITKYIVH
jgi:hypothetical protein